MTYSTTIPYLTYIRPNPIFWFKKSRFLALRVILLMTNNVSPQSLKDEAVAR